MFNTITSSAYRTANGCIRSVQNVSFHVETHRNGFLRRFFGARNISERLHVNVREKNISIDLHKINENLDKAISKSGVYKPAWFCEETKSNISSTINKVIDRSCQEYNIGLSKNQKNRVFDNLARRLGGVIKLDPKCTQSSINQIINNDKYVSHKLDKLLSSKDITSGDKQKIKNIVKDRLTDLVFERKFDGVSLEHIREDTRREVLVQLRCSHRNSAPF